MDRRRLDLAIVVLIAAVANFVYFRYSKDFFYPDSYTYLTPAKMLLAGHGFATTPGVPETLRTPGYPLILIAFGLRTVPVIVVQHVLNVFLAAALYLLARRRLGSRLIAMTAAIVFALDVPTIHYANKLLTETTFTVALFVIFLLALDLRRPILLGILCGVLVLMRPVAIVYFAVLAVFFAFQRKPRRTIAMFTIAALALPLAWGVRNRIETGVFTVSSISGSNLLLYRAAGALVMTTDAEFRDDIGDEQADLQEQADDEIRNALHVKEPDDLPHAVRMEFYAKVARRVILQHPFAFTLLTIRGVMVDLFESDWESIMVVSRLESSTIRLAIDALTVAVFLFAVIGVIALWRRDRAFGMLLALTIAYFVVISAGGEAEARFRVPVVPQLALAAASGVGAVRRSSS